MEPMNSNELETDCAVMEAWMQEQEELRVALALELTGQTSGRILWMG
jgi:hypothetical protein